MSYSEALDALKTYEVEIAWFAELGSEERELVEYLIEEHVVDDLATLQTLVDVQMFLDKSLPEPMYAIVQRDADPIQALFEHFCDVCYGLDSHDVRHIKPDVGIYHFDICMDYVEIPDEDNPGFSRLWYRETGNGDAFDGALDIARKLSEQ